MGAVGRIDPDPPLAVRELWPRQPGMTKPKTPRDTLAWLNANPPLDRLMEEFPALWQDVGPEVVAVLEEGRAQNLSEYSLRRQASIRAAAERIRRSKGNPKVIEGSLPDLIRGRMALQALDKCYLAAAAGTASGRIRFNLVNGYILQRLLFRKHLTRKPVSRKLFSLWWPLVSQKRILMPLVQPKGIYCFYTRELIRELVSLIGGRPCLEIAAGDGTLSGFLRDGGVAVNTTDSHEWSHTIEFPPTVEKLDAKRALDRYNPEVVLCSWPPPGNSFERQVFSTRAVRLYVVIGSRYPFASGNWDAYRTQQEFEWHEERQLSSLVLPPELDSAVLLFRRLSQLGD